MTRTTLTAAVLAAALCLTACGEQPVVPAQQAVRPAASDVSHTAHG